MSTGDNSRQMTVEERLVDKFKNEGLAMLVGDEDAITELARRAVDKALFAETRDPRPQGNAWEAKMLPSPAVKAAHEVAQAAADKMIAEQVALLVESPAFQKTVREALAGALLKAIDQQAFMGVVSVVEQARIQTRNDLMQIVGVNGLRTA